MLLVNFTTICSLMFNRANITELHVCYMYSTQYSTISNSEHFIEAHIDVLMVYLIVIKISYSYC